MPPKSEIEFTGVRFTGFHFVAKPKRGPGGPSVRVFFEASWLEPIRVAMGWKELDQETVRGTPGLRGALIGCAIILTPVAPELASKEITMDAQKVGNFEVFFPEQTGKKEKPAVLRFRMESAAVGAETIFGTWGRILNDAPAHLKISYGELKRHAKHDKDEAADDRQEELPLKGDARAEHEQAQRGRKPKVN